MKKHTFWIILTVAAVLLATALAAGAASGPHAPGSEVESKINYQGRLTDAGGHPLDGTYPMRFEVHDDPTANSVLWDSGIVSVAVRRGLFNTALEVDADDFDGQGLWLRIYVDGEWLSPRQEVLPVPYALSLRPGAVIQKTSTGAALSARGTQGFGLYGYSEDSNAVYGVQSGSNMGRGYGGYFASNTGIGVYGYSGATGTTGNAYTPGVYGRSANGVGVYGLSEAGSPGVYGESDGHGVFGLSQDGTGVYGRTEGNGDGDYGVWGKAEGSATAVHGYQSSTVGGLGVYGKNDGYGSAVSGYNTSSGNGVWGNSLNYRGVAGATNRPDQNYGLYTDDNLHSDNIHTTGAIMQVVQNGGDQPLERGDVVAIAGLAPAPDSGGMPLIQVRKAEGASSTAILGVVASTYAAEWLENDSALDPTGANGREESIPESTAGPVAPGAYMLVVVQGPVQVKVDAGLQSIQPGDLLSSAPQPGFAGQAAQVSIEGADTVMPGTALGKALEPLSGGQGLIYVWLTLY